MVIIEAVPIVELNRRENFWIKEISDMGASLTNIRTGDDSDFVVPELKSTRIIEILSRIVEMNGCHIWDGYITKDGIPKTRAYGESHNVRRLSYSSVHGDITPGLEITTSCRTFGCVKPAHMDMVTKSEAHLRGYKDRRGD